MALATLYRLLAKAPASAPATCAEVARRAGLTETAAQEALSRLASPERCARLGYAGPAVARDRLGRYHVTRPWTLLHRLPPRP